MPKKSKEWYKSRTLWFNVVTVLLAAVDSMSGLGLINPELLAVFMGVGNMALRVLTKQPLR